MWSSWVLTDVKLEHSPSFWVVLGLPDAETNPLTPCRFQIQRSCLDTAKRNCCSSHGSCNITSVPDYSDIKFFLPFSVKWHSISPFCFLKFVLPAFGKKALTLWRMAQLTAASMIYVAMRSWKKCSYCSTHGSSKALTPEETRHQFKCAANSHTNSPCVCLPVFLQLLQHYR